MQQQKPLRPPPARRIGRPQSRRNRRQRLRRQSKKARTAIGARTIQDARASLENSLLTDYNEPAWRLRVSSICICTPTTVFSTAPAISRNWWTKRPAAACRPWPSPITAICLPPSSFYHEAATRGVKPIIGCEVYVARGSRHDRGADDTGGRDVRRRGASGGTRPAQHQSPGPALRKCRRLPQPGPSGVRRAFWKASTTSRASTMTCWQSTAAGLIALSACLSGAVAEPLRRAALRRRARRRPSAAGHFRQEQFLPRSAGPGPGHRSARQSRTGAALARERHSAGGHQRLPLPDARRCPRAGSADVHSDRQDHVRSAAHAFCHRPVLFQDRRGDGPGLRRIAGGAGAHRGHRRALQRAHRAGAQFVSGIQGAGGLHASTAISSASCAKALRERVPFLEALAQAGPPDGAHWRNTSSASPTRSR